MAAETGRKPSKDAVLWQQCLIRIGDNQDEQAFAQLFDIFAPKLRAFSLAAQPGASMVADELVQDVMLKIWNKAHLYQPKKSGRINVDLYPRKKCSDRLSAQEWPLLIGY
jgi:RNA polymerase sigma-70 factor (ECF subfamily)